MSVHLLHVFSTFAPGGPQVRTTRLLPGLPSDWRHSILALDGDTRARELLPPGLPVEILPSFPKAGTARTTLALSGLLRRLRPELLLTYNFGALDALLASNLVPPRAVVHHEDGFLTDEIDGFKRRRVWLRRLFLPRTKAVIVPSRKLENIALETWKLAPPLVRRIPNGIRLQDFSPGDGNPERRAQLGIPPGVPLLGWVGHLRAEKNPVRAIQALARTTGEAHLLMLGDGPERAAVEDAVQTLELGRRVHLAGHRNDPRGDYRALDALLISSDTEQMPVALLEAMATGLAVVSTDVGDVRAMLPEAQGPFVIALDGAATAAALARALDGLLARADLRRELGSANRTHVEREYSFEGMLRAYHDCYAALLRE